MWCKIKEPHEVSMKKMSITRYMVSLFDTTEGEKYTTIFRYFLPELITALILNLTLTLIDAKLIANLKSTSLYATLGVTSTLLHFITKVAEGISVGAVVLCGHFNGALDYRRVGRAAITSLWTTVVVGAVIAMTLYLGAGAIYTMYGVPARMVAIGIPFLRLRAISVFLMFLYFALIGFLRGVKNTRVPMILYLMGGCVFVFFDYLLINGYWGFPCLKLQGSAVASVLQYSVMLIGALLYVFFSPANKKYVLNIYQSFDKALVKDVLVFSWPVMLDKATLAAAKMFLGALIAPMGKYALASFAVIKDMEQLAFVPAIAFAQVITLLVSNAYGKKEWDTIKGTIRRVLFLTLLCVMSILIVFSLFPVQIIQVFDTKGAFTSFAAVIFPLLSVLVCFDLLQLILAGALRGAGDVRTVMWVRVAVFVCYFIPVSYGISLLPLESVLLKFFLLYASFYFGNGLMGIMYILRFRGDAWKSIAIKRG